MEQFPTEEAPLDIMETRQVKRITIKHVFVSAIDAFNVDRGGVFTLKGLFKNPGDATKDYLGANRFHYTPPFRILVITTALALFAISLSEMAEEFEKGFSATVEAENPKDSEQVKLTMTETVNRLSAYTNLIIWTYIPFIGLLTFLINLKKRYNFAEHLVFQTYLFCIANILSFLFPLDHFLPSPVILAVIYIAMFIYYIYGYKVFLDKSWIRSILEMLLILIVSSTIWVICFALIFGIVVATSIDKSAL